MNKYKKALTVLGLLVVPMVMMACGQAPIAQEVEEEVNDDEEVIEKVFSINPAEYQMLTGIRPRLGATTAPSGPAPQATWADLRIGIQLATSTSAKTPGFQRARVKLWNIGHPNYGGITIPLGASKLTHYTKDWFYFSTNEDVLGESNSRAFDLVPTKYSYKSTKGISTSASFNLISCAKIVIDGIDLGAPIEVCEPVPSPNQAATVQAEVVKKLARVPLLFNNTPSPWLVTPETIASPGNITTMWQGDYGQGTAFETWIKPKITVAASATEAEKKAAYYWTSFARSMRYHFGSAVVVNEGAVPCQGCTKYSITITAATDWGFLHITGEYGHD
jgi:hypothetical protein